MKKPEFDPFLRDAELKIRAKNTTCDVCGKQFDEWDAQESFGFNYLCGYGTKFRDRHIHIDLCCDCFDKLMDVVIPMCKENPIIETERQYCGAISFESGDRLNRIDKILNKEKTNKIIDRIEASENRSETLSEIEKELTEEGYDVFSIPSDRDSYWKNAREQFIENEERS